MPERAIDLPAYRTGRAAPEALIGRRAFMDTVPNPFPAMNDVSMTVEEMNGVRVLRFLPSSAPKATMLYIHGGGFRLCAPDHYTGFASHIASAAGVEVISIDYRLAPEHPFPAAISDAAAVFAALSQEKRDNLVIAGDSAGGGLAASLTRLVVAQGVVPMGVILYSPWLDLTVTRPSFDENGATDPLFSKAAAVEAAEQYLQGHAAQDPLASPIFGEVEDFPPSLISVGAHEVLRDDSLAFAEKLKAAQRDVELICTPHMQHVAPTRDPNLLGAAESMAATLAFLSRVLHQARRAGI